MKDNYRKLAVLLKWFPDAFYAINIYSWNLCVQGKYNAKLVLTMFKHKFQDKGIDSNGYINLQRGNIKIILTD